MGLNEPWHLSGCDEHAAMATNKLATASRLMEIGFMSLPWLFG
jgi:hypothetical protein